MSRRPKRVCGALWAPLIIQVNRPCQRAPYSNYQRANVSYSVRESEWQSSSRRVVLPVVWGGCAAVSDKFVQFVRWWGRAR
eukprot:6490174-Prymnesium_polylepis.1